MTCSGRRLMGAWRVRLFPHHDHQLAHRASWQGKQVRFPCGVGGPCPSVPLERKHLELTNKVHLSRPMGPMSWPLQLYFFLFPLSSSILQPDYGKIFALRKNQKGKEHVRLLDRNVKFLSPVLSSLPSKLHTNMSSHSCTCNGCNSHVHMY